MEAKVIGNDNNPYNACTNTVAGAIRLVLNGVRILTVKVPLFVIYELVVFPLYYLSYMLAFLIEECASQLLCKFSVLQNTGELFSRQCLCTIFLFILFCLPAIVFFCLNIYFFSIVFITILITMAILTASDLVCYGMSRLLGKIFGTLIYPTPIRNHIINRSSFLQKFGSKVDLIGIDSKLKVFACIDNIILRRIQHMVASIFSTPITPQYRKEMIQAEQIIYYELTELEDKLLCEQAPRTAPYSQPLPVVPDLKVVQEGAQLPHVPDSTHLVAQCFFRRLYKGGDYIKQQDEAAKSTMHKLRFFSPDMKCEQPFPDDLNNMIGEFAFKRS